MPDLISSSIGVAALLLTVYFAFRQENRVDGQSAAQRLVKIEAEIANQQARQQGFQAEIESVADHAVRERQALTDNFRREHEALRDQIKEQIKDVPTMRELLYRLVERMENVTKTTDKLDLKMDQIVVLLTRK
jgi:peptidoglycan hydrolase CwlO-like protein